MHARLNDFSVVVLTGEELPDYLADRKRRSHLHPELQAELEFGIEQSQEVTSDAIIENVRIFLDHGKDWEDVNQNILAKRAAAGRAEFPAMDELEKAVEHELAYQTSMWQGDYEQAYAAAREVLGDIVHSDLKGYRALWYYLAGSAALLATRSGALGFETMARAQFARAKEAARGVPWLVALSRYAPPGDVDAEQRNAVVLKQIERVETALTNLGILHNRAYTKREREILDGLATSDGFEQAQTKLGELLGFAVGKVETDASPDPWWMAERLCLVFEDHAGAKPTGAVIDATKARQAASHIDWMRINVPTAKDAEILAVLVTPAEQAKRGAEPSLSRVGLWPLDDFRLWAQRSLAVLRDLRTSFSEPGDLEWRIRAAECFEENGMDAPSLHAKLKAAKASERLAIID